MRLFYAASGEELNPKEINIDLLENDRDLDDFLETLLKSADQAYRRDLFSNTAIFDEVKFPVSQNQTLIDLIESVRQVIENVEYRSNIVKHLDLTALKRLIVELIELLWKKNQENQNKALINALVKDIKEQLNMRTSAIQVSDIDLYDYSMDIKRVKRFSEITRILQSEAVISEEDVQGFRVEARKGPYRGAMEVRKASGIGAAFSDAFAKYGDPYQYLQELLDIPGLAQADIYKLFVDIKYKILNKDGVEVSGGERSEFRLLQEIKDAQKHDILLIDEPESSFDNLFLKSDVNLFRV